MIRVSMSIISGQTTWVCDTTDEAVELFAKLRAYMLPSPHDEKHHSASPQSQGEGANDLGKGCDGGEAAVPVQDQPGSEQPGEDGLRGEVIHPSMDQAMKTLRESL